MLPTLSNRRIIKARFIDLTVIWITFFLSGSLLSVSFDNALLVYLALYSCIILVSVRLGKRFFSKIDHSSSRVMNTILGNAAGFSLGAIILVSLQFLVPEFKLAIGLILLSSVSAFFVLGTLAPLLKMDRPFSSPRL